MQREALTTARRRIRVWAWNDVGNHGPGKVSETFRQLAIQEEVAKFYFLVAPVDAAVDLPVKTLVHVELLSPEDPIKLWRRNQSRNVRLRH